MAKAPHDGRIGIRELIDFMERCSTTLEKRMVKKMQVFIFRKLLNLLNVTRTKASTKMQVVF